MERVHPCGAHEVPPRRILQHAGEIPELAGHSFVREHYKHAKKLHFPGFIFSGFVLAGWFFCILTTF